MTVNDERDAPEAPKPLIPGGASGDAWLDRAGADVRANIGATRTRWRRAFSELFSSPVSNLRSTWRFLITTPGKMFTVTIFLSVAIFAAGYSMSVSATDRQDGLDVLLSDTEPLSYAAHNLYTNLSLADTVATSSFVRQGVDSKSTLERCNAAIDQASVAATQSASGIDPDHPEVAELITTIQRELPVYTAMVETARTNSRMGNPVGVTYMANASGLMRDEILPAAAKLFEVTSDNVAQQQTRLTTPQWIPLSGLVAAVMFLAVAQWWLWRRTRRRFNRGFLAATMMMLAAILWVSVANLATWQTGGRGFQEASEPWDSLTTARILAQQAQTSETLSLLQRGADPQPTADFERMSNAVTAAMEDIEAAESHGISLDGLASPANSADRQVADVRSALEDWNGAYERYLAALGAGDYETAAYISTTTTLPPGAEPTTASAAARLDSALSDLIDGARTSMRAYIADGLAATVLVAAAVLLLAFGAIFSVWLGIRPRLQEYL